MSTDLEFTKENIDTFLKEVAKRYRKLNKNGMRAEIILIGGASILINYGFRNSTYDVDAMIYASSAMKDAINYVTDSMSLPNGWLNEDFKKTTSYTPRLVNYSQYYRTFSNVVDVRTVTGEYLVAMKLKAFRPYKHDISDIVGIFREHIQIGAPLTFERIDTAVKNLYDSWDNIPSKAFDLIQHILTAEDLDSLFELSAQEESVSKITLIDFENDYPNTLSDDNLEDILSHLMKKNTNEKSD